MKQTLKLLSCIALLNMAGCYSKPPSTYFVIWEKPGVNSTEVGKALLECGALSPYSSSIANSKLGFHEWSIIHTCMIQSGFHHKKIKDGKWCENCKDDRIPVYPPGSVGTQRSVERRLNSSFCKNDGIIKLLNINTPFCH
ncbi:hypothetical protein [Bartonella saheliensis]|uniref:hypothetical protein n=1 Tax=Bartonella saheliensis TaxID=1457016 RepID=UPI0011A812A7|nr:hypothetical protein [Bartonella saheliensis]